jgi:hypothetical protein
MEQLYTHTKYFLEQPLRELRLINFGATFIYINIKGWDGLSIHCNTTLIVTFDSTHRKVDE